MTIRYTCALAHALARTLRTLSARTLTMYCEDTKAADTVTITPRPFIRNASLLEYNDWYSDDTPRTLLLCSWTPRKDPSHCVFEQLLWGAVAAEALKIIFYSCNIDDLNTSYNLLFSLQISVSSCIFEITTVILLQNFFTTMSNTTVQITGL